MIPTSKLQLNYLPAYVSKRVGFGSTSFPTLKGVKE